MLTILLVLAGLLVVSAILIARRRSRADVAPTAAPSQAGGSGSGSGPANSTPASDAPEITSPQ